ncbi:MAG: hypothetical protein KGY46_09160 [Anaerolineales bacterium]|nr:hypothetical protein [Anaerolineales bacterium]
MTEFLKIAHLGEDDVKRLKAVEKEMGVHIMAFESGLDIADLSEEQIDRVQNLEEELGVTLVVYQK